MLISPFWRGGVFGSKLCITSHATKEEGRLHLPYSSIVQISTERNYPTAPCAVLEEIVGIIEDFDKTVDTLRSLCESYLWLDDLNHDFVK